MPGGLACALDATTTTTTTTTTNTDHTDRTDRTKHTNDASRGLSLDRMADDFELTLGLIEQALELEGS
jgi:hypothetical protein